MDQVLVIVDPEYMVQVLEPEPEPESLSGICIYPILATIVIAPILLYLQVLASTYYSSGISLYLKTWTNAGWKVLAWTCKLLQLLDLGEGGYVP